MTTIRNLGTLASAAAILTLAPLAGQKSIDLQAQQTPYQKRSSRSSCIVFAAVAALEAAYKRSNYGTLDLSEQFCSNVVNKTMWLHANWNSPNGPAPQLSQFGADRAENQLSTEGGGSGPVVVEALATGCAIPLETDMPYVRTNTTLQPYADYRHPHWTSQRNSNVWNLNQARLPRRALTAPLYYSAKKFYKVASPNNPAIIEGILKARREVVVDFWVGGTRPNRAIWQPIKDTGKLGAHSMLIIGFNRTSSNPNDWYFICKNSWGSTSAMSNGQTWISYDYLKKYVYRGAYIYTVNPPKAWPELAAMGRWNLAFDGHRGTLDIYHIPRTAQAAIGHLNITDRRLGTFYDAKGVAHRVNGNLVGNRLEFWFKAKNPNMCWDEGRSTPTLGRRFVYYMVDPLRGEMAGWHQDNPGNSANPAWGGYARVPSTINGTNGYLTPRFNNAQAIRPEMHIGLWNLVFDNVAVKVNIVRRNDALLTAVQRQIYAGFEAYLIESSGRRSSFTARVAKTRPADITLPFTHSTLGQAQLRGFMLSHQRGVTAGTGYYFRNLGTRGFYAHRVGAPTQAGVKSYYGSGCPGSNGRPLLRIAGTAMIGSKISFDLTGGALTSQAFLRFGTKTANINLAFLGAAGCRLYTDEVIRFGLLTSRTGTVKFPIALPNDRTLIGFAMTSQYGIVDPRANAMKLTTSNGARMAVGGLW